MQTTSLHKLGHPTMETVITTGASVRSAQNRVKHFRDGSSVDMAVHKTCPGKARKTSDHITIIKRHQKPNLLPDDVYDMI